MRFGKKIALTTVQIELGFASCNFPVAMHFFPNRTLVHAIAYTYHITATPTISIAMVTYVVARTNFFLLPNNLLVVMPTCHLIPNPLFTRHLAPRACISHCYHSSPISWLLLSLGGGVRGPCPSTPTAKRERETPRSGQS